MNWCRRRIEVRMINQTARTAVRRTLICLVLYGLSAFAHAAQPYATDDAAILDKGTCQLEIGRLADRDAHELWLLPACNFTGNVELTLGKLQFNEADSTRNLYVLQGKGVFFRETDSPHAWGWLAGLRGHHQTADDRRQLSAVFGSLLYTYEAYRDLLLFHVNIGGRSDRDDRRNATTWGSAAEFRMNSHFTLIGEFFGDDRVPAFHQLGIRAALIPDRLEFDVSYGANSGRQADTRWWTLGIRIMQAGLL